ncbi:sensor histidine kinase [Frateuria sp. GZRR35]|uniref:sensor histidine kinase n=1 Tax=Frateuria sp. GZRR35 TaxID=3351536 RepID=UPI003EDBE4A3
MENLIAALIPKNRYGVLLRYTASLAIVLIAFMLRMAMADTLEAYPMLLFIPAIFLSALLFDHGTGFFATIVSALLAAYFFMAPIGSLAIGWAAAVPWSLYVLIGFGVSALTEALRRTAEKLHEAERHQNLLREELSHRTKNDLMMVISVLMLQAKGLKEKEARAALDSAITRIDVIAKAHERLRGGGEQGRVAIADYLEALCQGLGELLRDVRPIAVRVQADALDVRASEAVSIGLIVNELVTNAFKYAYPDNGGGTVQVGLQRRQDYLELSVEDDGVGCPVEVSSGLGTRLVRLLASQMGGAVERHAMEKGCRVAVRLPFAVDAGA